MKKTSEEPKEDVTIINLSNIKEGHLDKIINESAKFKGNSEVMNESMIISYKSFIVHLFSRRI